MQKFKKMGFIAKGNKSLIFTFVHIPLLISTGKLINEMKGRVMVLNIANITKPLFQVVLFILVILEFFILSCFFLKGYIYERIDQ